MRWWMFALCAPVLWVSSVAVAAEEPAPLTPAEAAKKVGEQVTVKMEVKSATVRGEVGFLNSEVDHKSQKNFTIFLGGKVLAKFKEAEIDDPAAHFKGKSVLVKGKVSLHQEKPQIILEGPGSIKIVDEKKPATHAGQQ